MEKSISLIITVYNRESYLAAAIKSVQAQTWSDFELLIWDDGSTDRSIEIANQYAKLDKRIRVVASEHQGGIVAPTLKAAVAATSGDYIGWVDSDDMLAPTALSETIAILNNHPHIGLVYTDYQLMDEHGNLHGIGQRCQIPYSKERLLVDFMTFHFRLLRRSAYDSVGGLDLSYDYAEDYDLCLKLSEVTDFYHIAQPLYYYRRHSGNVTNNQFEIIRWTYIAIANALKRRKLDTHYELDMRLVAHFSIKPKHRSENVSKESKRPNEAPPTVSIIIPTYNRKQYLGHALDSIRCQTYTDYEIIVIDDGSTDGTEQWIRTQYPYVNLLHMPTNMGAAAARNFGIKNALGQFIAFLDSDDQWLPDYLQLQIHALKQQNTAVLAYCNYIATTNDLDLGSRISLSPSHPEDLVLSMLWGCFIHTLSQVVVPKSIFQTVGLLNEQLKGCHDWEFYLRLFAIGSPVHVPYYLVRKRWLPDSIVTQSNCTAWLANGLKVLSEFYRRPDNARYNHLRPTIETHFRATVEEFKTYIVRALNPTKSQSITAAPLVSIIIPCYNAADRIAACLQSCRQQTYPNIEIIIVDNNSTDDSMKIARQLACTTSRRVIFTHCQQQGVNYARNHGFTLATGDYIQWLDADDELTPNKIALQVAALEQHYQFDIAYGDWQWCFYQNELCQFRIAFTCQQLEDERMQRLLHNWQPTHAYLLRRSTAVRLQELVAWNPQTQFDAEREYFTFAAIVGFRFLHVPHSTVLYNHWSSAQMTQGGSYMLRVESNKQMFLRFQHLAAMQPTDCITEKHWFLLKQNWDLWKLAPVMLQQHGEEVFKLQHNQKEVGMPLSLAEARIVSALHQSDGAYTLEDLAQKIVRLFWKRIVQPPGFDSLNVAAELARWVGLPYPACPDSSALKQPHFGSQNTSQLQAIIDTIPLYVPLFKEQQLAVLYVLDKLRSAGMLSQFIPLQSSPRSTLVQSQNVS